MVENYEGASLDVSFNSDYLKMRFVYLVLQEATIQFFRSNRPFTLTLKDNHLIFHIVLFNYDTSSYI